MSDTEGKVRRPSGSGARAATAGAHPASALAGLGAEGASVLLLGLEDLDDACWTVLVEAGIRLERVVDVAGAFCALTNRPVPVVIAGARWASELTAAVRARPELASVHIVVGAAFDSPGELREALDAGADDAIRVPFEPEVLVARVAAGLRAARLRADEALLRSLVANIPGALYRCACDPDWTMAWISQEIEQISGYPVTDFIDSSRRTFASVIHPDDREQVSRSVEEAVSAHRPFSLEYRIKRRDGDERWVLERGQAQESGDGRYWLDGAIFDITVRRAAEQALREREVVEAQLAEVRASRARILDAGDRARREIERNLHDGAQQRFVAVALELQRWSAPHHELSDDARGELEGVLTELRAGLAELRDLARGLHPAILTDRGLERALTTLADHATVPVELRVALPNPRLAMSVEAAAYFTVCEALTNVAKHACATRAWVTVEQLDGQLGVEVVDDGTGGADRRAGSGLQGLRDRIAAVNGTLTIESRPSAGTVVRARLPIE
ncbi:MAG: PAS domain-containing protein [Solirubrobacteraceae bacterium]